MIIESKINKLLQNLPKGLVLLSPWLVAEGYSYELQQRYRKSGWLKSIGKGAMVRNGDELLLSGAIAALQTQAKVSIHIGGRSALGQLGVAHYLQVNPKELTLFADGQFNQPLWFSKNTWDFEPKLYCTTLFSNEGLGLVDYTDGELKMKMSGAARAMMECLSLAPQQFSLVEAKEIMEGLTTIRPTVVQELLENCKSVKVKRLFLFLAEKADHSWFKYVDINKIDLGSGNRSLVKKGVLVAKYQLVVPKELI
ncbi:MAG: type IV toxin-antitoxin system AbiEi family antitoxin [Bacteroidales bacterium]|nr:type IV toxin-antitoxin system AbiEi family antitoxin [Bacteroidales bacterium]